MQYKYTAFDDVHKLHREESALIFSDFSRVQ